MDFEYSPKVQALREKLQRFMQEHIFPNEQAFKTYIETTDNKWKTPPLFEDLKQEARRQGLWNLFLPHSEHGAGLTNLEYAPLAEIMGQVWWSAEIFNCMAPDTGNMETIQMYGTAAQKTRWLPGLLAGEIRSAFCMTEPAVASSDATNVSCAIVRDGGHYVINGRKWFSTGAMRENCEILIVMGKSDPDNPNRHQQQSMILVPKNTPGVKVLRAVKTLGFDDAPYGEPEIEFDNVRVPVENILLGEGRGFEIAQGRLGPGRIHHCMRLIGGAQRALDLALERVEKRQTFGRKLSEHQSVREDLAKSYCEIEQARLLTLKAADKMDRYGNKVAKDLIAAIKIVAPTMAQTVIDRAMQMHGAAGLTDDLPLAELYNYARQCRLADGPDQVHMMALGRQLVREYQGRNSRA
ncbi:acyl-CoA dehydrogenase family protein [Defluviimonas salinarum]|uniref:Acyl-CoA dehydrogenase family protein n=1 Tax=Defluviimonas salinarum TaxID=2992147 RepID=A0ABT3J7K5_9RHOB|nr:acyl-CoA dehydrogenase family protein [Defluviimonas salinarum]MCW3783630.1 acyl-CoA dehydrogenase family protein [Defluviimonas salinarum]